MDLVTDRLIAEKVATQLPCRYHPFESITEVIMKNHSKKLTQKRVRELFDYKDGSLFWKKPPKCQVKIGDEAGSMHWSGYRIVRVDRRLYLSHRMIWLYLHGYFPEDGLDHIDKNKLNNRIENLREVSQVCNSRNCGNFKHNKSGVKGVHWAKANNRWISSIRVFRKSYHIGSYKDFNEAVLHRFAAEQCLGWHGCDSTSPAYLYAIKNNLISHEAAI